MGIYIRGMKMPRFSAEYELRLYVDSDGAATVEGAYGCFDGEPFEAVPVPPHGRLIDVKSLENMHFTESMYDAESKLFVPFVEVASAIFDAPSIIPAEEVYGQYTDTAGNFHWCGTHSGEHTIKAKEGE